MEEQIKNLVPVDYSGRRVMTSAQLADVFSYRDYEGKIVKAVTVGNIKMNFKRNRDYFVEGEHYFKLEGDVLRNFKREVTNCYLADNVNVFYLWTEAGVLLHAKILNTPKAWEMYGKLVQFYFRYRDVVAAQPAPVAAPIDMEAVKPVDVFSAILAKLDAIVAQNTQLVTLLTELCKAQPNEAYVYILKMGNKTVKIGYTGDLRSRFAVVKNETGKAIIDFHITPYMSTKDARKIEALAHDKFRSRWVGGEFYDIAFNEACDCVDDLFSRIVRGEILPKTVTSVAPIQRSVEEYDGISADDLHGGEDDPTRAVLGYESSVVQRADDCPYPYLLAEMDANKLSISATAELMGMSRVDFRRKLYGERRFSMKNKIKLVKIFKKPIDYLLKWVDPAEQKNAVTNDDAE